MFEAEMHRYDRICFILWPLYFHDELANYGFKEGVVYDAWFMSVYSALYNNFTFL